MNTTITINASDIAREVAQRAPVGQGLSKDIVSIVFETIAHELAEGHEVRISGFGTFKVTQGRRNPRTGEAIPIQTRMMTISDIYDALTAADRPYKSAVAPARALDIMVEEVRAGQLDQELFRLFVDAKVFEANT